MNVTLRPIVFARYPAPGQCKTRLIPALGAEGAATVHRRLVERTLDRLAPLSPILAFTGATEDAFHDWLGGHVTLRRQVEGDLGTRMLAAGMLGPALIVGSDIPDMSADPVRAAVATLASHDLVLGPAEDGGFWLIGWRRADPRLFANVRWGGEHARADVVKNAAGLGWTIAETATLADLDEPQDLQRWPDLTAE